MERDERLNSSHRDNLQIISQSGEHLLALINEVLEISRIETGYLQLNKVHFDLHDLIENTREMFQARAADKKLILLSETSPDLVQYVYGDASKIRQILNNLISNSIKFTLEGGVSLRIRHIELDDERIQLDIEVEDSGLGIALDEQELLFQPFSQTSSGQHSAEGTGLGLSITAEYIKLMNGEIQVNTALNKGTTIHFTIEVELGNPIQVETKKINNRVIALREDQPTYRILVVEDKEHNRRLLVNLLEIVGFEVRSVTNGKEAIELYEEWLPHLIWMDIRMPVMNGYEATKYVRDNYKNHEPVIIALTASAFESDREVILAGDLMISYQNHFENSKYLKR